MKMLEKRTVLESQWFAEVSKEEPKTIQLNGVVTPVWYYNLAVSNRDFSLWSKGIRAHRHWKFNETKKYYGLTGGKANVARDAKLLLDEVKAILFKED